MLDIFHILCNSIKTTQIWRCLNTVTVDEDIAFAQCCIKRTVTLVKMNAIKSGNLSLYSPATCIQESAILYEFHVLSICNTNPFVRLCLVYSSSTFLHVLYIFKISYQMRTVTEMQRNHTKALTRDYVTFRAFSLLRDPIFE